MESIDGMQKRKKAKGASLTRRQLEVLQELAEGYSNKEIAGTLYLSPRTIDMHVSHILDRLNCRSRTQAVRVASVLELI